MYTHVCPTNFRVDVRACMRVVRACERACGRDVSSWCMVRVYSADKRVYIHICAHIHKHIHIYVINIKYNNNNH